MSLHSNTPLLHTSTATACIYTRTHSYFTQVPLLHECTLEHTISSHKYLCYMNLHTNTLLLHTSTSTTWVYTRTHHYFTEVPLLHEFTLEHTLISQKYLGYMSLHSNTPLLHTSTSAIRVYTRTHSYFTEVPRLHEFTLQHALTSHKYLCYTSLHSNTLLCHRIRPRYMSLHSNTPLLHTSTSATWVILCMHCSVRGLEINPFMPSVPWKGHLQTLYTQIRRRRTRRLIRVYTACISYMHIQTSAIVNRPVQRIVLEDFTWSKMVNFMHCKYIKIVSP